jgi:F420-dependent oxidoreductase-like protein
VSMALRFGVHTGPQYCTLAELRQVWTLADERDFDWVSVWDHFYPAVIGVSRGPCLEGVASMTALAAATTRVTVGCLVFCVLYRHPALLAKAAVTIDHVSGGRMELGLGIGWHETECDAYGIPFPSLRERLDRLEESAQLIRRLFDDEAVDFEGRYYRLRAARCEPKPVAARPRIWIGGMGEKRLLRIVARHADGWNVPFVAPEVFATKSAVLTSWCERESREPAAIMRTVNVGLALASDEAGARRKRAALGEQFGSMLSFLEPGMLIGTPAEVIDRVGAYRDAGAERVVLALRAPFDVEGLALFRDRVLPAFR